MAYEMIKQAGAICVFGKQIKIRWDSEEEAIQSLKEAKATKDKHRKEKRIYECPWCGGWHLTSKDKKEP